MRSCQPNPKRPTGACLVIAQSHLKCRDFKAWAKANGVSDWWAAEYVLSFLVTIGFAYLQGTARTKRRKRREQD
jgi:hypothetical protein